MFELYFILIFIPRKIRSLARERNQSALAWSLMAIGAWLGAELFIGLIADILVGIDEDLEKSGLFLFAVYIIALASALTFSSFIIKSLGKMPIARGDQAP